MSQRKRTATEAERREFVQNLGRFHETPPDHEKAMLDTLVITAEGAQGPADVQGYWWFWGNDPATPQWYSGLIPPGETSRWWQIVNTGSA